MAQVVGGKVKLDNGTLVTPQQGAWYDGQQYWGGTLSNPGQINSLSNQQGAGSYVSKEVVQQTNPANWDYIQQQQQKMNVSPTPTGDFYGGGASSSASPSGSGVGFTAPEPIDLPGLYNTLTKNAGIADLEQQLHDKAVAYADAQKKINDNPFLSEATRVGRIQKLSLDYNNNIKNDQDLLAMKKADVETQLNLQAKQFDINSQMARDALDRFNTLLQSGALDNASGEDIANITRATGLSSQAIQSAVSANKAKNVSTSVVSYDDGTNQGFAVINTKTGEIISKQVVAASKPSSSSGSYSAGSAGALSQAIAEMTPKVVSRLNSYGDISPSDWNTALSAWLAAGFKKQDFIDNFGQYADTNRGDFQSAYGFKNPVK